MEVNIPLLNVIKQIPRYVKILKELCTNKKNVKTQKKIRVGENVSVIIQRKLPQKYKNLGMFTIPYVIGNHKLEGLCLI